VYRSEVLHLEEPTAFQGCLEGFGRVISHDPLRGRALSVLALALRWGGKGDREDDPLL